MSRPGSEFHEGQGGDPDLFEQIVERIDDPIMIQDLDGEFQIVNEAVSEYADLPKEELIGTDEFDFMDEAAAERIQGMKERVLRSEEAVAYEITPELPEEGKQTFSTWRYPYYDEDGELAGTIAICRNVTELRERQRDLRRENDRLDEFASAISHDLRNPLNVALGQLRLLEDECDSEHTEEIGEALDRMGTIIEDTLTLAREGAAVTETEPVEIATVVEESWEMVETANGTLRVEDDFTFLGDPDRLPHVFENLFRNAVEHGGNDVLVRIGQLDEGFFVEDDGPGIPESDREAVFEAGHTSTLEGTGFGLTIVNRIGEAHGWDVDIADGRDGGARFEFTGVSIFP